MIDVVDVSSQGAPDALARALASTGFVQIVGHGLDSVVADSLWTAMDDLFALPLERKLELIVDDPLANRGYRGRGSESLSYSLGREAPPDLFESFNVGRGQRHPANQHRLLAPPLWPDAVPHFRHAAEAYLDEMEAISRMLDGLIGGLLGIADLAARSNVGPDTMACIRYQAGADEAESGSSRMGAHSDYTTFTVLRADPVPGLEIFIGGRWVPVVPEPGALMVNTGDLLAIWTNDRWPSTLHRVPLRGDGTDAPLRRSVAYFHYPDLDVVVEPLQRFTSDEEPRRYGPVTVADHLAGKLLGPKQMTASEGASTLGDRRL